MQRRSPERQTALSRFHRRVLSTRSYTETRQRCRCLIASADHRGLNHQPHHWQWVVYHDRPDRHRSCDRHRSVLDPRIKEDRRRVRAAADVTCRLCGAPTEDERGQVPAGTAPSGPGARYLRAAWLPSCCVQYAAFRHHYRLTYSLRTTKVSAILSCHPCFLGSKAIQMKPRNKARREICCPRKRAIACP